MLAGIFGDNEGMKDIGYRGVSNNSHRLHY